MVTVFTYIDSNNQDQKVNEHTFKISLKKFLKEKYQSKRKYVRKIMLRKNYLKFMIFP